MTELKLFLSGTIAQDFIKEGFSFNKSQFSFKKKIGKNQIECSFLFNHFSSYQEYFFIFYFTIFEIENELKNLWAFYSTSYKPRYSFLIREGDLHPKIRYDLPKYRVSYANKIFDIEDNFATINETRTLIKSEFFRRIPFYSDLKNFQKYVLNNYEEVVDLLLIWPALIALMLYSTDELQRFIDFLTIECDSKYLPAKIDLDRMIQNVHKYAEHKKEVSS